MNNVSLAFLVTLLAGLSTGVGGMLAFASKRTSPKTMSIALGFSAGIMIYLAMVEIIFEARSSLVIEFGERLGNGYVALGFFGGMFVVALLDRFIPDSDNSHHGIDEKYESDSDSDKKKLIKTGKIVALAVAIHNFPEGIVAFTSTIQDPSIGIPIAVAIAIHNIPVGIAIALPFYYATKSKKKAIGLSFLVGFAEVLGAVVSYLILMPFMNEVVLSVVFASVAGVMVFVSLDELLPAARRYGENHSAIYGFVAGMFVMAISIIMFG